MTEFGTVRQVEEKLRVSHTLHPKPQRHFFETPTYGVRTNGMTSSDEIWYGNTCGTLACF